MMHQSEFGQTVRKRKAVWESVSLRSCNPYSLAGGLICYMQPDISNTQ